MNDNPTGKLVNLRKFSLSSDHMSLLLKGRNFYPTLNEPDPGPNRSRQSPQKIKTRLSFQACSGRFPSRHPLQLLTK